MSEFSLLKIAVVSGILFGWYMLFLRNRRMHQYNRFFLVAIVGLTIALPLIEIPISIPGSTNRTAITRAIAVINSPGDEIMPVVTGRNAIQWNAIIAIGYLLIALVLLLRPVMQIARLYNIKRRSKCYKLEGVTIVPTDLSYAPFSFFHTVYWNNGIDMDSPAGQRILKHELAHIHQRHTSDKLFVQAACAVCWPVPFFWLIKKELSVVHEFLADESSIENNDTAALAEMLLCSTIGYSPAITNTFYSSPIKRRIIMMTKNNSTRYRTMRMLSVLPIVAAAFVLTSFRFTPAHTSKNHKITVVFDAGHGGQDAGATHNGIAEKDLNMRIVNKLSSLAAEYNIVAVKTRDHDNFPTFKERVNISNATKADAFISIHVNKESADNKMAGDYIVYVSQANKRYNESVKLATTIAGSMSAYQPQVMNKGLILLKESNHPSVLIECGNMSKEDQIALLLNDGKLEDLCRKILSGIANYKS